MHLSLPSPLHYVPQEKRPCTLALSVGLSPKASGQTFSGIIFYRVSSNLSPKSLFFILIAGSHWRSRFIKLVQ